MKNIWKKIENGIRLVDNSPLWWVGILLLCVVFVPFFRLGTGSVFEIHDQLDESILNYVLTAKYLGTGADVFPEMLNGVNASGMQPAAVLFLPLYRLLPVFAAFLVQYGICFLCGFLGMYFCMKELTGSSILSAAAAGCFCMLPMYPVYGLTEYGLPLVLYAAICLWKKKHLWVSFALILLFGLTSHLVCTGYVVLGFWLLSVVTALLRKKEWKWMLLGFLELLMTYLFVNRALVAELLLGNGSYVSHREEMVNYGQPFLATAADVFVNSAQHAPSLHKYLILPIVFLLGAAFFLKKQEQERKLHAAAMAGFLLLLGIALFYGLCKSTPAAELKNHLTGFLRYFQIERFYWIYPAAWQLEFGLAAAVWWKHEFGQKTDGAAVGAGDGLWASGLIRAGKSAALVFLLLPTLHLIKVNSVFYMNVNQLNNGSGVTGYISWESYYAEDLMAQLEEAIGRDMGDYRVAHLGISPAPSLMHGFYTVDGYSNNYPLEYKHRFRRVIEKELTQNEEMRLYFDQWGNRCYLYNRITGTYYNVAKDSGVQYRGLEFDMEALRELGCQYLFSGGEIADAERMGLEFMGYFETEDSYWGIWLYALKV